MAAHDVHASLCLLVHPSINNVGMQEQVTLNTRGRHQQLLLHFPAVYLPMRHELGGVSIFRVLVHWMKP